MRGYLPNIMQWSTELGINYGTLKSRLNKSKLSPKESLVRNHIVSKRIVFLPLNGKLIPMAEWAKKNNLSPQCLFWRLKHWGKERTLKYNDK